MTNILFIMADQLAARWLGCYGNPVDTTPTLDRLAAEGVRFDRCYATFPVCAPNRATALTGRSPVVHGVVTNNQVLRTDTPTYAHILRQQGYRTGGFGKFHQTPMAMPVPGDLDYLGFDEAAVTEDPKWGAWLDWVRAEHPEHYDAALAVAWPFWPNHPPPADLGRAKRARRDILVPQMAQSPWPAMYPSPLPAEVHDTTFITDRGLDFIRRHVAAHGDRPFFCHLSYVDPHDPYDPPEPYASLFDPAAMPPPLPPAWMEGGYRTLAAAQRFWRYDRVWDDPEVVAQLRALYFGSLRFIDDQIGRLVTYLKAADLWDDTVLVFTTDHGEMLGDQGLITKGSKHYDAGIRVPLIVAGGGAAGAGVAGAGAAGAGTATGTVSDRLTCTLDFVPTFCDWAGVEAAARPPLEGRSLAPVCAGEDDPAPWSEISVASGGVRSVVTGDGWRLTRFVAEGRGQMFDLNADPDEQHNRYEDPACADRRQALLERLVAVESRPARLVQYRNLPVAGDKVWVTRPGGEHYLTEGPPVYPAPASPYGRGGVKS